MQLYFPFSIALNIPDRWELKYSYCDAVNEACAADQAIRSEVQCHLTHSTQFGFNASAENGI